VVEGARAVRLTSAIRLASLRGAPSTTLRSLRELRAVPLPRYAPLRGGGRRLLAFSPSPANIVPGRLAVDEPLANRVRSGRKQP
jgi:hypothetical protein